MHLLISLVSHNHLRMLRTQAFFVTIFSIIFHGFLAKANRLPDSTYEACKPINCGVGPDIKYPFYIVDSQDTCGYPGFEVVCKENRPVYQITGSEYIIKDIHYGNQSFRLVNSVVLNSTCIAPRTNFSFERSSFKFDPNFGNLLLFYYCDITFPEKYTTNPIACVSSKNHSSYAILDDGREFIDSSAMPCQEFVVAPVEMDGLEENLDKVDYVKLLKDGFTLTWPGFSCSSCEKSGGYCGVVNEETVCFCPDRPHRENCYDEESHRNKRVILIPVFGAIILILSLTLVAVFVLWRRKKGGWRSSRFFPRNTSLDLSLKRDLEQDSKYLGIPVFSYSELEEATNNFDCSKELGDGGFGTVYYGKLRDGREVAVKRLYEHNTKRTEQFRNEIEILASLRHRSLVTLYGYTSRRSNKLLLVYEYIPNGTVADHLHGESATDGLLTWPIRMNIAVETASALAYLHASGIIHRDVKTNNILLDENFCVKVADFGLSRHCPSGATHISTAPQGTAGYVDPEYHEFYQLTDKSDVYSFGVVLIELISSMPAVDITRDRHEINLSNLAMNRIVRHAFDELIDPSLGFETDGEVMRMTSSVAELAFQCLQPEKDMRPTMDEVLETLKGIQGGDLNSKVEAETGKNSDVSGTVEVHPSPELEDSILLKGIRLAVSPISVTDKWVSHSSTSTSNSR